MDKLNSITTGKCPHWVTKDEARQSTEGKAQLIKQLSERAQQTLGKRAVHILKAALWTRTEAELGAMADETFNNGSNR